MGLFNFKTGYWGLIISSFVAQVEIGHAVLPLIVVHPLISLGSLFGNIEVTPEVVYSIIWTLALIAMIVTGRLLLKRKNKIMLMSTLSSIVTLSLLIPLIKPYTESELIFQSANIFSFTILFFPVFLIYSIISLINELVQQKVNYSNNI